MGWARTVGRRPVSYRYQYHDLLWLGLSRARDTREGVFSEGCAGVGGWGWGVGEVALHSLAASPSASDEGVCVVYNGARRKVMGKGHGELV